MTYKFPKAILLFLALILSIMPTTHVSSTPSLPNPHLYLTTTEVITRSDKRFVRYHLDVLNKDAYPAEMFAPAPELPPCGKNTKSSRTWVDIYEQSGKRLYGFCALSKPADLNQLWFETEEGTVPPSYVYIEMNDRQTNTKYKSNLADTSM